MHSLKKPLLVLSLWICWPPSATWTETACGWQPLARSSSRTTDKPPNNPSSRWIQNGGSPLPFLGRHKI